MWCGDYICNPTAEGVSRTPWAARPAKLMSCGVSEDKRENGWGGESIQSASSFNTHKCTGTQVQTHTSLSHTDMYNRYHHTYAHTKDKWINTSGGTGNKKMRPRLYLLSLVIFSKRKNSKCNKKFPFLDILQSELHWVGALVHTIYMGNHFWRKRLCCLKQILSQSHFYSCAKAISPV